jgi:aminopeptidase N
VLHDNLSDMRRVLNNLVYQKGGWTLHMLRGIVGTEAFWTAIRNYYQKHRDASATTDDFKREMEDVSNKDLTWFFDQWLKRPGSPQLKGSWRYLADQKQLEVTLSQIQTGDPYRLPLELGIGSNPASLRTERVEMTARDLHLTFKADSNPQTIKLDPNHWVLMKQDWSARGQTEAPASIPAGKPAADAAR